MTQEEKDYLIAQADDPNVENIGQVSDGYHTFDSLYNQRLYLWAALVKAYKDKAWKTRRHNNGELCFGDGDWFLVGITTPQGDYSYHYEIKYWDLFDCKEIEVAPPFDGHTDKDVSRVMSLEQTVEISLEEIEKVAKEVVDEDWQARQDRLWAMIERNLRAKFILKSCEWLMRNIYEYSASSNGIQRDKLIEDFKKVMSLETTIDVQHEPTFDSDTNPALKRGGVLTKSKHVVVPSSDYEDDYDRARRALGDERRKNY